MATDPSGRTGTHSSEMENTAQEDTPSTVNEASSASVDTGAGGDVAPARVVWYRDWLLPVTVLTVLVFDQASKYLVKSYLPLYDSWPDNDFIRITHSRNDRHGIQPLPGPDHPPDSRLAVRDRLPHLLLPNSGAVQPAAADRHWPSVRRRVRQPDRPPARWRGRRFHRPRLVAHIQSGRLLHSHGHNGPSSHDGLQRGRDQEETRDGCGRAG